jgi:hypothetical protein
VGLHDSDDQGVVNEESGVLADDHRGRHQKDRYRQDLHPALSDSFDGAPEGGQPLHFRGMAAEAIGHARHRPAEQGVRLDGHHLVGDLGQQVK